MTDSHKAARKFEVVVPSRYGVVSSCATGSWSVFLSIAGSLLLGMLPGCGDGASGIVDDINPASVGRSLQSCKGIMPLGDSITLGLKGGYRTNLYTGLQQNNCSVSYAGTQVDAATPVVDQHHEGHSAYTISDIAGGVDAWMASTQPNIILLMIGTNDTAWWSAENADQIGVRHNELIKQLRAARPDAWILVASLPPQASAIILPNSVDRAVLTQQLNAVIRKNVDARAAAGERFRFVDVYSVLSTEDLFDGIHPTEAAYSKIAQKFLEEMRIALDPQ